MGDKKFAKNIKTSYENNPNGKLNKELRDYVKSSKFEIRVVEEGDDLSWSESYIGTSFGSTKDYGKTWDKLKDPDNNYSEKDLIDEVRNRVLKWSDRQINFYDKDRDLVYTGLVVIVKKDGYSIYPDEESTYEF
jgi:hypothetical protein